MREEEFNITEEKAPSEFQKLIEGLISPVDFVSRTDFNTINWNGLPDDKPRNQDRTLAWLASYRALENQPALLEKLLASSPIILEEIDWNARPLDEKNIQRGRTVTLMACSLARRGQPVLLEKLLASFPVILEKIDWNACPLDKKNTHRGETVALIACSLARRGQPVLLEKLLAGSPVILEKIDWNACPLNEKYTHRGETVAWMACSLARRGQPALLEKLLAGSPAIMEKIDWNACPLDEKNKHRGFTVALQACTLASKGLPALLEKLFSRSSTILENIDWCSKHFKLIGNTPPVSLLSTVFTQNNARLFLLLLEWSGPALQNLKTALLSSGLTTTDTTRQPLFCWIDFSLLVNSPKKPTIPDADEIAKLLQNIKKILPDLYGRACLHTGRQWPCLRQRFYPDIPPASPDYGTAQWELANMYLNEQDEKETPAKRELGLKEALSAASRCWYHEIRMSPDQTKKDGRLLVRIIVKAILGLPPGELPAICLVTSNHY